MHSYYRDISGAVVGEVEGRIPLKVTRPLPQVLCFSAMATQRTARTTLTTTMAMIPTKLVCLKILSA